MVLDAIEQSGRYVALHPAFSRAFAFLRAHDVRSLPAGRQEIDGDRLFVLMDRQEGRGHDGARLEAHRRYIDIQCTVDGEEEIGWRPHGVCQAPAGEYDADKDIRFFDDAPVVWLPVPAGRFVIFFPEDAHAPLAGRGALVKAIFKIEL